MCPPTGLINPINRLRIVVFPAPDSPTRATVSPDFTERLNLYKISFESS